MAKENGESPVLTNRPLITENTYIIFVCEGYFAPPGRTFVISNLHNKNKTSKALIGCHLYSCKQPPIMTHSCETGREKYRYMNVGVCMFVCVCL